MAQMLRPSFVADGAGVRRLAEKCVRAGSLALDTEADSLHAYFHKVCLIQVTVCGRHFVVDPLVLSGEDMQPLFDVTADEHTVVLMHGADYDIRVLERDFGARVHGLRDTQIMAHLLGEERTGLAALLSSELGVKLDKKYQRANWGRRPLPDAMLSYAAADTAYLDALAGRFRTRLEAGGRWRWAVEEFRSLEEVRYEPPVDDPYAFERVKGVSALKGPARDRAHSVYRWRDGNARRLDVPPFKVLGNRQLVDLAAKPPRTVDELTARKGLGLRFARRWGKKVLAVLREPEKAPEKRRVSRRRSPGAEVRARTNALLAARDRIAQALEMQPGLLCPRAMALDLAQSQTTPRSVEELSKRGLRGWRLEVLGDTFIDVLSETASG